MGTALILKALRTSEARTVIISLIMLLSNLVQLEHVRTAYFADAQALQQTARMISPGTIGTLADVVSLKRNTYSLALYPMDLFFKLLQYGNREAQAKWFFKAIPDLEARMWRISCADDVRVREYVVNILAAAGRLLVEQEDQVLGVQA